LGASCTESRQLQASRLKWVSFESGSNDIFWNRFNSHVKSVKIHIRAISDKGLIEMNWRDAAIHVLAQHAEPVHYSDIADEVAAQKLRQEDELGATPATSVNVAISNSIRDEGDNSPFLRTGRGYYFLRQSAAEQTDIDLPASPISQISGIINALGMFWERSKVVWKGEPRILGRQQQTSEAVDFCKQVGIYLLHDHQGVVYVGRTTDQPIGRRLQQHTVDRLNGRWDRFSWFGIYPVENDGSLRTNVNFSALNADIVISTLEAVLIEGLEPRQNRRRGDDLQARRVSSSRRSFFGPSTQARIDV